MSTYRMEVRITPRKGPLDPQGKAVERAFGIPILAVSAHTDRDGIHGTTARSPIQALAETYRGAIPGIMEAPTASGD